MSARVSFPALPPPELLGRQGNGAERPDHGAGDEEGDHEPTDEPEGRLGIVEEPAAGEERGGATGPASP